MEYVIPGYQTLQITHLILDYNGTMAMQKNSAKTFLSM